MTQPALFPAPRHRTARERRAATSAQAAIARALAHIHPTTPATRTYHGPYTACPTCYTPHQQPPGTPCTTCTREDTTDA